MACCCFEVLIWQLIWLRKWISRATNFHENPWWHFETGRRDKKCFMRSQLHVSSSLMLNVGGAGSRQVSGPGPPDICLRTRSWTRSWNGAGIWLRWEEFPRGENLWQKPRETSFNITLVIWMVFVWHQTTIARTMITRTQIIWSEREIKQGFSITCNFWSPLSVEKCWVCRVIDWLDI